MQGTERGERTAENIRYGQAVSESGMGGFTTGFSGGAGSGEFLVFFSCRMGWDGMLGWEAWLCEELRA